MFRRAARLRSLRVLRIAVFLLFALGLVLQPVLGKWGEAHELIAHASANSHNDHNLPHEHDSPSHSDDADAGDPMHLLLHYAHCCGHSAWAAQDLTPPSLAWFTEPPVDTTVGTLAPSHAATPFRPPIAA